MTDDKLYPISLGPPCKENLDMTKSVCKLCRKEYAFNAKERFVCCTCILIVELGRQRRVTLSDFAYQI